MFLSVVEFSCESQAFGDISPIVAPAIVNLNVTLRRLFTCPVFPESACRRTVSATFLSRLEES